MSQLKVVVVVIDDQPHLVFVATKDIDVGDELLLDYNDSQSKAEFLKSCPVCSRKRKKTMENLRKRIGVADDMTQDSHTETDTDTELPQRDRATICSHRRAR